MNKFILRFIIAALTFVVGVLLTFMFLANPLNLLKSKEEPAKVTLIDSTAPQTPPAQTEPIAETDVSPADLAIIKKFAESYEPRSTEKAVIPSPPDLSEKELQALTALANSKTREHEKYVVLIFLRLYRFHIEHFKQSYELDINPLTNEFLRLMGANDYQKPEIWLSYLAANYVEKHPELLKSPLIAREMKRIDRASEKILKEIE